ncbi:MAG: hybrid sensor histidine kinase/response regulator [Candidatus Aminicenantes bacterium]|nr:MAG: hybrid sensor histidine kinase/response regulator [Candidatus Aminicenantes bacterium]
MKNEKKKPVVLHDRITGKEEITVKDIQYKDQKKPSIFIAEDSPESLKVLCQFLKQEEYRISAVGNGKQALEMIPEIRPDLVLLDIMMPGMDGFAVCEQLKKITGTKDIPIIFITARADKSDIVKGFALGAVDYVTKPFNGTELLARIKTHLELKASREELKELNATKDKFFSIIAHDLKNPLQSLLFSIDILYGNYDSFDEAKKKSFIYRFHKSAHQLSALLGNLLDWSRSQRGRLEHRPEKLDIGILVTGIIELLKENAREKNIVLSHRIKPDTFAFADKNMMETVIRNLVSNAVKFTGSQGEVKIKAYMNDNRVIITVSDNGVGMEPEDMAALFRIDTHKLTKGTAGEKGTGLGLILCKEFVEKNNGTIDVTSTPGKGSSFKVTLPAA